MSCLTEAEEAFAELLERCRLPELTTRELLEQFFAQSTLALSRFGELRAAREELARLRAFERAVARAADELDPRPAPASPPRLSLVPTHPEHQ